MNKSQLLGAACACISVFAAPQAMSTNIETYFGWNFVGAEISDGKGGTSELTKLVLDSITYIGGSGPNITQNMNFGGAGLAMPDGDFRGNKPTPTYTSGGNGESTRTVDTSLPIDWIDANVLTPWGQTYDFPTIGITGITVSQVSGSVTSDQASGSLTSSDVYIVGLIPSGSDTELNSTLGDVQSDIYEFSRQTFFSTDSSSGIVGDGAFIFSAAVASPVPSLKR